MVVQEVYDIIQENTRDEGVTWTESDVYGYINEAVKNTIQRAPQANSKKELVDTIIGTDQSLPDNAVEIINVISNGPDANGVIGDIINLTDVELKDAYSPAWRRSRATSKVFEWMKRSEPTKYLVWPPMAAAAKLYVEYSFYPADVTALADTISITNDFNEPIRAWSLYRTFSRDSESTPSVKRAEGYRREFEAFFQ